MNARSKRRSLSQPLPIEVQREKARAAPSKRATRQRPAQRYCQRQGKNFRSKCIFLLHAGATLVFFGCELASPWHRERGSFRTTRVKIEFFIPSGPAACQRYLHNQKKNRQIDPLAACCCDILHGVRWHVRDGRNYSRRGIRARDPDFVLPASAVVFADSVHDRRTLERAAGRGRLLCVGAARVGRFLGISGSVAVAGGEYL